MRDYGMWQVSCSSSVYTHYISVGRYRGDMTWVVKDNAQVLYMSRTEEDARRIYDNYVKRINTKEDKRLSKRLAQIRNEQYIDKYDCLHALVNEFALSKAYAEELLAREGLA